MDKKEFNNITDPELRLQYIYKELFAMSDRLEEVYNHQQEIGKLLINILNELSSSYKINPLDK